MERSLSSPGCSRAAPSHSSTSGYRTPPIIRRGSAPSPPPAPRGSRPRSRIDTSGGLDLSSPALQSFAHFSGLAAYSAFSSSEDGRDSPFSDASAAIPIAWDPRDAPWLGDGWPATPSLASSPGSTPACWSPDSSSDVPSSARSFGRGEDKQCEDRIAMDEDAMTPDETEERTLMPDSKGARFASTPPPVEPYGRTPRPSAPVYGLWQ